MRLCRFESNGKAQAGFYFGSNIVPAAAAAKAVRESTDLKPELTESDDLVPLLAHGAKHQDAKLVAQWLESNEGSAAKLAAEDAHLRTPVPRPNKLFLLAGNYAKHIEEGGGIRTTDVDLPQRAHINQADVSADVHRFIENRLVTTPAGHLVVLRTQPCARVHEHCMFTDVPTVHRRVPLRMKTPSRQVRQWDGVIIGS